MARKTKKYPPSRLRYLKKNPYVTFNVPADIKNKFELICKEKGLTKAKYIRQFVLDSAVAFDDLKKAHVAEIEKIKNDTYQIAHQKGAAENEKGLKEKYDKEIAGLVNDKLKTEREKLIDNAYSEGYSEAQSEYETWYYCNVCGKKITLKPNSEGHKAIAKYMKELGWGHKDCHDKAR